MSSWNGPTSSVTTTAPTKVNSTAPPPSSGAARTLESVARANDGRIVAGRGSTNLFIYPGFEFRVLRGLVTNFHLPESTLLVLVGTLIGRARLLAAYGSAVDAGYRFYSYGDACFVEVARPESSS